MGINRVKYVYFVGIGGIGMSALARYFKHQGCDVWGYDRTETPLTQALEREGIPVQYTDDTSGIPAAFQKSGPDRLVIYTPAIPSELSLFACFRKAGHELHKRAAVLGLLSEGQFTIAVAGTHGKTTTSTMVAHLLTDSGYGCSAFLGGIAANYETNTLFGSNNVLVVEADEYDRSFLTLHPDIAIVTSADADHLDIYGDHAKMQEAFRLFLAQVHTDGKRIVHEGLPFEADVYYGVLEQGRVSSQVYAENIRIQDGSFYFDFCSPGLTIQDICLGIPGRHNVENAVAAIQAVLYLDIPSERIKSALAAFKGVKRRFEYIVRTEDQVYIDDYAHHPEELKACLGAVRELYPASPITVVFQPHLFTRTRDFMDGFAESLSIADTLLLMEIYPARELPIPGIDSSALLDKIPLQGKHLMDEQQVLDYVSDKRPPVLVTVGAGNIDRLIVPLRDILNHG